jgi:LAO/AO transport system kinase
VRDLRAETDAPIVSLVAIRGEGVDDLLAAIDAHHRADSRERRVARARAQILSLAQTRLRTRPDIDRLAEAVVDGRDDPYSAAERLLSLASQPDDDAQTPSG